MIELWLLDYYGFERVSAVSDLYIQRDWKEKGTLLAAKVTYDMLLACSVSKLAQFSKAVSRQFAAWKSINDEPSMFNGCGSSQSREGSITMDRSQFFLSLKSLNIRNGRRVMFHDKVTPSEIHSYRSMAGAFLAVSSATLNQASCVSLFMKKKVTDPSRQRLG